MTQRAYNFSAGPAAAQAAEQNLTALAGHRSVGGIRASIYNAMPVAGVEALRDFMIRFRDTQSC